jgi:hypothetical protein
MIMNRPFHTAPMSRQLEELRTDLFDLAYTLEREGRADAADVAVSVAGRVREILADGSAANRGCGPEEPAGVSGTDAPDR